MLVQMVIGELDLTPALSRGPISRILKNLPQTLHRGMDGNIGWMEIGSMMILLILNSLEPLSMLTGPVQELKVNNIRLC